MSNVVLLAINAKYVHSSLAVWAVAAGVSAYSEKSHNIEIIEAAINRPENEIAGQVAAYSPDVVGISTYIWNAQRLPALIERLRRYLPGATLVLGGPEASFNAEYWLCNGADYVLMGEGEESFPALLDALEADESLSDISGLCRLENGIILCNPVTESGQIPPEPHTGAFFKALNGRIAYLETSRGCPFSCAFCLSGGCKLKLFPLDRAKRQMTLLSQSGTRTIKLVDRTFNCNPARAYELFEHVIRMDTTCCFHFEVAADLFDDLTLELLRTAPAGRIQLEIGLQSFFEPTLKAVSRKTDLETVKRNIFTLISFKNIHIHVDLIAGLPFETLESFINGFNLAYSLQAHTLQLGFLKLLHGSSLREQAKRLGLSYGAVPPYEIIETPWMCKSDLDVLRQTENALQRAYNSGRFLSALRYALEASRLQPFELFFGLGGAFPNHGMPLEVYAENVYKYLAKLDGVDSTKLRDCLVCDWLASVKGKNLPQALRVHDKRLKHISELAQKKLGHTLSRGEAAILSSEAKAVFVDDRDRDPVTGLYALHFWDL